MGKKPRVRTREPVRDGRLVTFKMSDDTLPLTHPARLIWEVLGGVDLSPFLANAKAVEGHTGNAVTSPRAMLTFWGYALYRGITSAREIARMFTTDLDFIWIAGGLHVHHCTLSEFMTAHRSAMQSLFTDVLAILLHKQLISFDTMLLAQDGTKVRASAGQSSFRQHDGLEDSRTQAELHLKAVLARMDEPALSEAQQCAREVGAMDVLDRTRRAIEEVKGLQAARQKTAKADGKAYKEPKASTTDPDARIMCMPDEGYRPAYNVQLAAVGDPTGGPVAIVGVQVSQHVNDSGSLEPMIEQIEKGTGKHIDRIVADSNHISHEVLIKAKKRQLTIISRPPKKWKLKVELKKKTRRDPEIDRWQQAMNTSEARAIYRGRKAIIERPNATLKDKFGLWRVPLRGVKKVTTFFVFAATIANILAFGTKILA